MLDATLSRFSDYQDSVEEDIAIGSLAFLSGKRFWVNPNTVGNDNTNPYPGSANNDGSLKKPFDSIVTGYSALQSGRGDGLMIQSNGTTTAQTTSYLTSAMTWSKYNCTVFGIAAPTGYFSRARIGNASTATSLASMITISGENNRFINIHVVNGGSNIAAVGCVIVTAGRNYFNTCHFLGGGHATPGAVATCNSLDLRVSECTFKNCTFGTNSTIHAAANAPILISTTAQGQNLFERCRVISRSDTAGHGAINISGAATMNGWIEFRDFTAQNFSAAGSGGQTALTTMVIGDGQNNCGIFFSGYLAHPGWAAVSVLASKAYTTGPVSSTAGVQGLATIPAA